MYRVLTVGILLFIAAAHPGTGQTKSLPELRLPVLTLPARAALTPGGGRFLVAPASPAGLMALAGVGGVLDPLDVSTEEPGEDEQPSDQAPMNRGRWGFVTPWVEEPEDLMESAAPTPRAGRGALQVRSLGALSPSIRRLAILQHGVVRYAAPDKDRAPDLGLVVLPYERRDDDDLRDLGLTVATVKGAARPKEGEQRATVPRGVRGMFNLGFGQFNPSFLGLDFGIPNVGAGVDIGSYLYNPVAAVLPSVFGRIR